MTDREFCALVDGLLTIIGVPFRHGSVELADKPPTVCIGYSFYDVPKSHGDGAEDITEFIITFDIIGEGTDAVDGIYERLLPLLIDNDFTRAGGLYASFGDMPQYYRKSVDFRYCG